ncbi:sugar transferase [Pseudomonadales bacterium]|nr:sugar transferase [Pseudomonadales bacterium]
MQRLFDVCVAVVALFILSPLLFLVAFCLRFSGEGEIFYRQERIGYKREKFRVFKFATMVKNSPNIGSGTLTMVNDARVLPLGKVLRKTKINELPQLLNILFGDLGLVGPRPLVPEGESHYGERKSEIIRSVRPGVTGIGSLVLRDEEAFYAHRSDAHDFYKNTISPYKFSLEEWYIERQTFFLDIKIMLFTAAAIVWPDFSPWNFFQDLPRIPKEMLDSKV